MSQILKPKRVRKITETIVLVLMLWVAPVPVGHCHGDCGPSVTSQQMTLHFQLCHGGIDNAKNWPSGWHWHWVFPLNGEIAGGCELPSAGCDQMLSDCLDDLSGKVVVSHSDPWKFWDVCKLWQLRCLEAIPNARQHSFQTVALLQSGQSLPELLGIMRC